MTVMKKQLLSGGSLLPAGSGTLWGRVARALNSGWPGTDAPNPKRRLPAWALCLGTIAFLLIAGVYAYSTIFSQFRPYDDEGCMMIFVKGYLDGHPLYDGLYIMYGPFYFFYEWIVHTLCSLPVSHDTTGLLCVVHWVAAAAILALAAGRMTRSVLLAFFVFMQGVVHLTGLAVEPGHPQELVAVLLAVMAAVLAKGTDRRWVLVVLGAIGAALVFTKINVGAFYGIALALALVSHTRFFQSRRILTAGLFALSGSLPLMLMKADLTAHWARQYGWQACVTVLAVGAVGCVFGVRRDAGLRQWVQAGFGFVSASAIFIGVLLLTGTSLSAIVDCLVICPSKLAGAFCVPLTFPHGYTSSSLALLAAAVAVSLRSRLDQMRLAVLILKGIYGFVGSLCLLDYQAGQLGYFMPWIWLLLVPSRTGSSSERPDTFPRTVLCMVAAWQGLQAYPVAGTQVVIATFLPVLIYSLCLYDAVTGLAAEPWLSRQLEGMSLRTAVLVRGLVLASLLYLFAAKWCMPQFYWQFYASQEPLKLRGARHLRLPARQAATYRALTQYVEKECDTFVTYPGLNSLYFWTGKTPPTCLNCGAFVWLSDEQQAQIVAALQTIRRPLIVVNEHRIQSMSDAADMGAGPLGRFIRDQCHEVKRLDNFRILAPSVGASQFERLRASALP